MSADGNILKAAILVSSDRAAQGIRPDLGGPELSKRLGDLGYQIACLKVVPDDKKAIIGALRKWVDESIPLILTTGGTGLGPRDITPEATLEVIDRRVPGMEEVMRNKSLTITAHAMLSRAVVGVAGQSLIINLPGNPKGALQNLSFIEPALPHALSLIRGEQADP